MKQIVKALDTKGECFKHIITVIVGLSFKKIKAGVFDGPQIRTLIRDDQFVAKMTSLVKSFGTSLETIRRRTIVNL